MIQYTSTVANMTASVEFESEATAEILLCNENEATVNSNFFY